MTLHAGDCIEVMRELDECSVDAIVTDPPYGISFMAQHWDSFAIDARTEKRDVSKLGVRLTGGHDSPNRKLTARTGSAFANKAGSYDFTLNGNRAFQVWVEQWATEALRVLKPGGHALVFGGTRTYHRLASGMEDAGFEIRDCIAWLFGSGFPKSLDVSKAIDKAAGAEREVVGPSARHGGGANNKYAQDEWTRENAATMGMTITAPATPEAERWQGWGTALKPAHEPIVLARKPLAGTVAANVLEHGTGAINVGGCRVDIDDRAAYARNHSGDRGHDGTRSIEDRGATDLRPGGGSAAEGRWPANVVLDEEAGAMLDEQTGELQAGVAVRRHLPDAGARQQINVKARTQRGDDLGYGDSGGASRFFYCAKASRAERNAGLEGFEAAEQPKLGMANDPSYLSSDGSRRSGFRHATANVHPTVKPIDLMRWLVRLVTPPGGTVLDPFLGSGTTGAAAALEGFAFIGIEREPDYLAIAQARIAFWTEHGEEGLEIVRVREAAERVREEIANAGQLDLLSEGAA